MAVERIYSRQDSLGRGLGEKPGAPVPYPEIIEFLDLADNTAATKTRVPVDEPLFQAFPSKLVFTEYEPYGVYTKTLYFRNNDVVPRRIRVDALDSPHFSIQANPRKADRIASGMEASWTVTFRPHERRDYSERLVCVTEREKFVVNVLALGPTMCLDLPDRIDFDECPVKYKSSKTLLVRNVGEVDAKFALRAEAPFSVSPSEGFVPVGASVQVNVSFDPRVCGEVEDAIEVMYENGESAYVSVRGSAADVDVGLSSPVVNFMAPYITLTSQNTVKVQNRSDVTVAFNWSAFATVAEEREEQERLRDELLRLEQEEYAAMESKSFPATPEDDLGPESDDSDSDDDGAQKEPFAKDADWRARQREKRVIAQKYKMLRKAVMEDSMHFADEAFSIYPLSGVIAPHSEFEVEIKFKPMTAAEYASIACLDITGSEARIPLKVVGTGIGPQAALSFSKLDLGDIFMDSKHRYKLSISNCGDIQCVYALKDAASEASKFFRFEPTEGALGVNEENDIDVYFSTSKLGPFNETFQFSMLGSNETLKLRFRGRVVGPTFTFDVQELDYGKVAYNFLNERDITLTNTSDIPMTYELRVPQDGKFGANEFTITPSKGTIPPMTVENIHVDFRSRHVGGYDMHIALDIKGVGNEVHKIPIHGYCRCASVVLGNDGEDKNEMSFGDCFIRYDYNKEIVLVNQTPDLPAHYKIADQLPSTAILASLTPEASEGWIEAGQEKRIPLTLRCESLGKISMPVTVRISGSEQPALNLSVTAESIGPIVTLDAPNVDFGKVPCLKKSRKEIVLTNESLIPAPFHAFIKTPGSRFKLVSHEGCLDPGETAKLIVVVCPDDTTLHRETLHILITEGKHIKVPMTARGTGTTIVCKGDIAIVDFGYVFTTKGSRKEYLIENRGKRNQTLTWSNLTAAKRESERKRILNQIAQLEKQKDNKKSKKGKLKAPPEFSSRFTFYPDTVELKPNTGCRFTITAKSPDACAASETFRLESRLPGDKKLVEVLCAVMKSEFVVPSLKCSDPEVAFEYVYKKGEETQIQQKQVEVENVTALPLSFIMKAEAPFSVNTWEADLQPGEKLPVLVSFDPIFRDERKSKLFESKLIVSHHSHPHKNEFSLSGQVHYPNLSLSREKIEFGSILNGVSKVETIDIKNVSTVDVEYAWNFVESGRKSPRRIPTDQAFDILPISGRLAPGESQRVEVKFYGHPNKRFKAAALCEVVGGPDYEVSLVGEASEISYKIDRECMDFGKLLYDKKVEKIFHVANIGKVAFDFNVSTHKLKRKGVVDVHPKSGRIGAKGNRKFTVKFSPCVPDDVYEVLVLEIAHFEPFDFPISGRGIFAGITLSLPRVEDERFAQAIVAARESLEDAKSYAPLEQYASQRLDMETPATSASRPKTVSRESSMPPGSAATINVGADANTMSPRSVRPRLQTAGTMATAISHINVASEYSPELETEANRLEFMRYIEEGGKITDSNDLTISKYYTDFGNVVIGAKKRRKMFHVRNSSPMPVNFEIDSSVLTVASGFSIDPSDKITLEAGQKQDFKVSYHPRRGTPQGPVELIVPILVKGGARVELHLIANATSPEITLSSKAVDFEEVQLGHCKTIHVQLKNTSLVPADWTTIKSPRAGEQATSDQFVCTPLAGHLKPGKMCNVEICFTPSEVEPYEFKMPFSVQYASKPKYLSCRGVGKQYELRFSDHYLTLPPSLGRAEPVEATFTIENASHVDAEIVCLELDEQYLIDEEMMRSFGGFDESQSAIRMTPRVPGEGIQQFVLNRKLDAEKNEENEEKGDGDENAVGELEEDKDTAAEEPTYRSRGLAVDVVIDGPPLCGTSTQCEHVATTLGLNVLTLDEIVVWGFEQEMFTSPEEVAYLSKKISGAKSKFKGTPAPPSPDILKEVIKARLQEKDCGAGVVIDGLRCSYAELDRAGILNLLEGVRVVLLTMSRDALEERHGALENARSLDDSEMDAYYNTIDDFPQSETMQRIDASGERSIVQVAISHAVPRPHTPRSTDPGYELPIPTSEVYQLVRYPYERKALPRPMYFTLTSLGFVVESDPEQEDGGDIEEGAEAEENQAAPADEKKSKKKKEAEEEKDDAEDVPSADTRWVIPANSKMQFLIKFHADNTGKYNQTFTFETVNQDKQFTVKAKSVTSIPTISSESKNVFMKRVRAKPEHRIVMKKFIIQDDVYEFGPLRLGRTREDENAEAVNSEVFRISNNGILPIENVSFCFASQGQEDAAANSRKKGEAPPQPVFSVEPTEASIDIGETQDIVVWAFPSAVGDIQDTLICNIMDNPEPVKFEVRCCGQMPEVELDVKEIDFQRMLLKRKESKSFFVKNTALIPIAWKLDLSQLDPLDEFQVYPTSGVIHPRSSTEIAVLFEAKKCEVFEKAITVIYSDNEGGIDVEERQRSETVNITAEAYDIQVELDCDPEGTRNDRGELSFGSSRVFEHTTKSLSVKNVGKYTLSFDFAIRRRRMRDLIDIEPPSGTIEPGQEAKIDVTFSPVDEMTVRDNKDIECTLMEAETGEKYETFNLAVSGDASFSKFRLQPLRGLNFGAVKYEQSPERTFELKNDGSFAFSFQASSFSDLRSPRSPRSGSNSKSLTRRSSVLKFSEMQAQKQLKIKEASAKPSESASPDPFEIGAFLVTPGGGILQPGESIQVTVKFSAKGKKLYRERVALTISGRDPSDHSDDLVMGSAAVEEFPLYNTLVYELLGESCIPGINTAGYESIFEEQAIVRTFDQQTRGVFSIEERVLSYGARIPTNVPKQGVCERFKISNPNKIKTFVDFAIEGRNKESEGIFEVQPTSAELPAHESMFVNVFFKPKAMSLYAARFTATVKEGKDILEFDVQGEGTLPCVTIQEPTELDDESRLSMKFGRLQKGKKRSKMVTVRNDGIVDATVRFDMPIHECVSFSARGSTTTLKPNQSFTGIVTFNPQSIGTFENDLNIRVLHNEYELQRIHIVGEAFMNDLTFEGLPGGQDDRIDFGFVTLAEEQSSKTVSFQLMNHTEEEIEYEWAEHVDFSVDAKAGKISANGFVDVVITFQSSSGETVKYADEKIVLSYGGQEIVLLCSGVADSVKYELPIEGVVNFRNTMMFQSRVHTFNLKNTSQVPMQLDWEFIGKNVPCPFTITPGEATIDPESEESFTLRFAPLEVYNFDFVASAFIQNLHKDMDPLSFRVTGTASRPICHFDIERSTYLDRRQPSELVLPSNTQVVEFTSLGIDVLNSRRFMIVNPTNLAYEFQILPVGTINPRFKCITQKGIVAPGKRYELLFQYIPENEESQESLFEFSIPEHNIKQSILLAGQVREPRIEMDTKHINFHSVLTTGRGVKVIHLVNREHLPFSFEFMTKSINNSNSLKVSPTSGTIPPSGSMPIEVVFTPKEESDYNWNLRCVVDRKPMDLSLNIKGNGTAIHERLVLDDVQFGPNGVNSLDFAHVHVNDVGKKEIAFYNDGTFSYEYVWTFDQLPDGVNIEPRRGTVRAGDRNVCVVSYNPSQEEFVESSNLSVTIGGGRRYKVDLCAKGVKPNIVFSFVDHDFGPCFLPQLGGPAEPETAVLRVTNNEIDQDVSFECLFSNKKFLDVLSSPTVLKPGEYTDIPITYTPREVGLIQEQIPFEINGLYTINVKVQGEGIKMVFGLANPDDLNVHFGSIRVGNVVRRRVRLVNKSRKAVTYELEDHKDAARGRLAEQMVSFTPTSSVVVNPRQSTFVEITFAPKKRLPQFTEDLFFRRNGVRQKLLAVSGACQAIDAKLETDTLSFGAVFENCSLTKKLQIENIGDVGTRVSWASVPPEISIAPKQTFLPANSQCVFDVTFTPRCLQDEYVAENIVCIVDGAPPLTLNCTGRCISMPDECIQQIDFECEVRSTQQKTIELKNTTKGQWVLQPTISNAMWSGAERLVVGPNESKSYEVVFKPILMTTEESKHEGNVFFSLPDGTSLLYKLKGTATAPPCEGNIEKTCDAKRTCVIPMKIPNWVSASQRFHVNIEVVERKDDLIHAVSGPETIDVPGDKTRTYKVSFYGYIPGTTKWKVTFTNKETGEYLYYLLTVNVGDVGMLDEFTLRTQVRTSTSKVITVANPLPPDVVIDFSGDSWWKCDHSNIRVLVHQDMTGESEGSFCIEYRPLKMEKDVDATLVINCKELGEYRYALKLFSAPTSSERSMAFRATLGRSQSQVFRFRHFSKEKSTTYKVSVENDLFFIVPPTVPVGGADSWDGVEAAVEIQFQPQALGDVRDVLVVESDDGSKYTCALTGVCKPPRPQGPFDVAKGKDRSIEFRNVFNETKEFRAVTDSEHFVVGGSGVIKLDGGKSTNISVKCVGDGKAKLVVSCPDLKGVNWSYYLSSA